MCDEKDAERFLHIARLQEENGEALKARNNYLEASSIYVLQSSLKKSSEMLEKANYYYNKAESLVGRNSKQKLSQQELAKLTLQETDLLTEIKKIMG